MQPFNIFDAGTNMSTAPSYPMSTAPASFPMSRSPSAPMSTAPASFPMSTAPFEMPKPFDYGFGNLTENLTPEIAAGLKPMLAGYSDKDMEFLKIVKSKGYTPQQAFQALQDVRKQIETKATEQNAKEESAKRSVSPIGDIVGGAVAQAPRILANTVGLMGELGGYINPMDNKEATKAISERIQGLGETGGQFVEKYGAFDPMSTAAAVGKEGANIGSVLATPGGVLGAGLKSAPLLGKVALGATAGAIDAAKYSAVSRAELPTGSELAIGASLGGLIPAAGGLYKSLKGTTAELSQAGAKVGAETENLGKYGLQTQKGIIDGQEAIITKPSKTIGDVVKAPFATKDTNKLVGRALTPSYAGKTGKQIVFNIANTEKRATELHKLVRTGKLEGSLESLQDSAETVVNGLDTVGERIGGAIGKLEGKSKLSKATKSEINGVLSSAIEQDAGAFQVLRKFAERTKSDLPYSDLFKVKKIYSKEIGKLTRNGDGGTDSYAALVKGVQEITDVLEDAVEKKLVGSTYLEDKRIYKVLKELVGDIAKSAQVDARRSPQTLTEQLGFIQALTSPGEYAKQAFAREIGEMNTRGGTWKQFIDILDERAVKNARNVPKPKVNPPKIIQKTTKKPPNTPNVLPPKGKTQPSGQAKNPIKGSIFDLSNKRGSIKLPGKKDPLIEEARKYDNVDDFINKGFTYKPPKKLYRGVAEDMDKSKRTELGFASLGKGFYTTPDKSFAKKYGKVQEFDPVYAFPRNPLVIERPFGPAPGALKDWLLNKTGFKNISEFHKKYGEDYSEFLQSLGYDGVVIGDEVVKYGGVKTDLQIKDELRNIWTKAKN